MFCKTSYYILYLLGVFGFSCAVWEKDLPTDSAAVYAVASSHEAAFEVNKNSVISSKKGNIKTAEEDVQYITSALTNIDIDLSQLKYKVDIYKQDYAGIFSGNEKDLVAFLYQFTFDDFERVSTQQFPQISKENYQKTSISPSKAPVQCYAFVAGESLKLLCHYDYKPLSNIAGVVAGLK